VRKPHTTGKPGKTRDDFRAAHDRSFIVPQKIEAAIKQLGADHWEYEAEFLRVAGISTAELGRYRSQFEKSVVAVRVNGATRYVWAGSEALAEELRAMVQQ